MGSNDIQFLAFKNQILLKIFHCQKFVSSSYNAVMSQTSLAIESEIIEYTILIFNQNQPLRATSVHMLHNFTLHNVACTLKWTSTKRLLTRKTYPRWSVELWFVSSIALQTVYSWNEEILNLKTRKHSHTNLMLSHTYYPRVPRGHTASRPSLPV